MTQNPILGDLKVIELASFVLAPAAGTVMSDFGAEVLHIEHPGIGDVYRYLHTVKPLPECEDPYCWVLTGRNKKSVAIDLKQPEGQEIVYKLVAEADVFITNYHPSVLEALQMRFEDLEPINSRLIYAHATGYGDRGEEIEKPGYDATAWWARSGLMDAVRPKGGEHALATPGMGDHPSAMALFGAIMLGLYRRQSTGSGGLVKTSLAANGAWSNSILLQAVLCGATPWEGPTRSESQNALLNPYTCADGGSFYLAMIGEVSEWGPFTRALDRADLFDDPRFVDVPARRAHSQELVRILDQVFGTKPLGHWRRVLDEHKVTFGVVSRTEDVVNDEQLIANGVFPEIEGAAGLRTVANPIDLHGVDKRPASMAPVLGQHTKEVLSGLGYSAELLGELAERGVVRVVGSSG